MENLVKRYFWVVNLVALAALAYLAARVVNNVVAGEIASIGTTPAAPSSEPAARKAGGRDDSSAMANAESVKRRNLFNSEPPVDEPTEDVEIEETPVATGEPPGPDDECKESDAPVSLLATMAATPSPLSMAVVDDGQTPQSRVVREGQSVGDATIARIYRSRLVLSRGSSFECVELGKPKGKGASYTPSSSYSPPPVASNDSSKKIEEGIKKVGKDRYEIDREMLNEQLENMETLTRQARVIPHYRDGKPQGFKIVGVRPGSLLSQLGVRSGDVLKSVSGEEIDSPNKALELLERLKTTGNVPIEIDRRGQPVTLEYDIK